jgi:Domain of unknown function (DUF397)
VSHQSDRKGGAYSDASGGQCVEVASEDAPVLVRDTADRDSGTVSFTVAAWREFADSLR